eukprot:TRINITY_DN22993_c0_g1_i1.p1 TRINITY_DN22993_c0_g1~~TRINITY_DN22993_c0_g1_i1.p1  ORF type:complete len:476 (+),score=75.38 TRINITY_DN22993_c0_g1_i1:100-1527(+)
MVCSAHTFLGQASQLLRKGCGRRKPLDSKEARLDNALYAEGLRQPRILGSQAASKKIVALVPPQPAQIVCKLTEPCPEPSPVHGVETTTSHLDAERSSEPKSPCSPEPAEEVSPRADEEGPCHRLAASSQRPAFKKPSREARERQLREGVREFCGLRFDEVDPVQQSGLTCRMLAQLKALSRVVGHWQEDGTRSESPAFELLGLSRADMTLVTGIARKAETLISEYRFREAYNALSRARLVFDARHNGDTINAMHCGKDITSRCEQGLGPTPEGRQPGPQAASKSARPTQLARFAEENIHKAAAPPPSQHSDRQAALCESSPHAEVGVSSGRQCGERQGAGSGRRHVERTGASGKYLCRMKVGIEEEHSFQVCRRIIGPGGENMKRIVDAAGKDGMVKIRLRGKGSKYLEGPEHKESSDSLMLCVSATSRKAFERSAQAVEQLLASIHEEYLAHCKVRGLPSPNLELRREAQRSR